MELDAVRDWELDGDENEEDDDDELDGNAGVEVLLLEVDVVRDWELDDESVEVDDVLVWDADEEKLLTELDVELEETGGVEKVELLATEFDVVRVELLKLYSLEGH